MRRFRSGDLALLIHCRLTFPKAHADEVRAYIANYSPHQSLYSSQDIHDMEERLEMTRKRGSSRALQSLLPLNMMRRRLFWSEPLPVGCHGLDRNLLIDVDEAGFSLNSCVRSYGKARRGQRVVRLAGQLRGRRRPRRCPHCAGSARCWPFFRLAFYLPSTCLLLAFYLPSTCPFQVAWRTVVSRFVVSGFLDDTKYKYKYPVSVFLFVFDTNTNT